MKQIDERMLEIPHKYLHTSVSGVKATCGHNNKRTEKATLFVMFRINHPPLILKHFHDDDCNYDVRPHKKSCVHELYF